MTCHFSTLATVIMLFSMVTGCGSNDILREEELSKAAHELRTVDLSLAVPIHDATKTGKTITNLSELLETVAGDDERRIRDVANRTYDYIEIDTLQLEPTLLSGGGVEVKYTVRVMIESAPGVTRLSMTRTYETETSGSTETLLWE